MKKTTTLWPFSLPPELAPLLLALAACTPAGDAQPTRPARSQAAAASQSFSFAGEAGTHASVLRVAEADGGETLHGETTVSLGGSAARCIVEDVSLDARGRLVRADVSTAASCDAEPETWAHLDPASGTGRVTLRAGDDDGTRLRDPGGVGPEAPWIYLPEALPGRAVATPVAAWVALHAARLAPSLTLIDLPHRQTWRVPSDQVAVPTERGTTVVLGSDGADVEAGFVERIRLTDDGVTMQRVRGEGEPAI